MSQAGWAPNSTKEWHATIYYFDPDEGEELDEETTVWGETEEEAIAFAMQWDILDDDEEFLAKPLRVEVREILSASPNSTL